RRGGSGGGGPGAGRSIYRRDRASERGQPGRSALGRRLTTLAGAQSGGSGWGGSRGGVGGGHHPMRVGGPGGGGGRGQRPAAGQPGPVAVPRRGGVLR